MASIVLIGLTVILVLYRIYKYMTYKPDNFPPGPPRIPIFGTYLFMLMLNHKHLHRAVQTLCKWYKSKVIGIYIAEFPTVLVNSYEGVREVLNRQEFDGRPDLLAGRVRDPHYNLKGIFFTDGPFWKEQRRFILRYLRDYGFGRRFDDLEHNLNEELMHLVDMIKYGPKHEHEHAIVKDGKVLLPYALFQPPANALIKVFSTEKFPRDELGKVLEAGRYGLQFQRYGDDFGKIFSITPWIRHLFPNWSGFNGFKEGNEGVYRFIQSIIMEQYKKFDKENPVSFMDLYFMEMKKAEEAGKDTTFELEQMTLGLLDFFFPALTAIGTQLSFLIQQVLINPKIQSKMQAEIDNIVGSGRLPTLDDRQHMDYTEAAVREILRFETLVPSNVPHRALVTTDFLGYTIPKDTFMVTGLDAMHNDPDVWQNPNTFWPERFFDSRGRLSLKKDIALPFGAGKRLCAGETYARNALFLITATIFQNFNVRLPPGESPPDRSKNNTGLIITTPDFWVEMVPR